MAEGAARILWAAPGAEAPKPPQIEGPVLRQFDPDLGWTLAPSLETRHRCPEYAVGYRTNAQGARASRDYATPRTPGLARIAAFGDSFVFGVGVEEEERFTDRLASLLGDTEVLNFGVPGYGTDQALLRFEREGAAFRPDVVLLGHLMEHVLRNLAYEHRSPTPEGQVRVDPKPRFERTSRGLELRNRPVPTPRTEEAAPVPPPWWTRSRLASWIAHRLDSLGSRRHPFPDWDEGKEGGPLTEALVERFAQLVRDAGGEPVLVVLGDRAYLDGRLASLADRTAVKGLLEFCASRKIPALDLLPSFDEARSEGRHLFYSWDGHWTPEGHRLAAETLARFLRERGWPPPRR